MTGFLEGFSGKYEEEGQEYKISVNFQESPAELVISVASTHRQTHDRV
jgi:hypothetical protein